MFLDRNTRLEIPLRITPALNWQYLMKPCCSPLIEKLLVLCQYSAVGGRLQVGDHGSEIDSFGSFLGHAFIGFIRFEEA